MIISHQALEKRFAQLMRIEEHRSQKIENQIRRRYNALLRSLRQYVAAHYPTFNSNNPMDYVELANSAEQARLLEVVRDHLSGLSNQVKQIITNGVEDVYTLAFTGMQNAIYQSTSNAALRNLIGGIRLNQADVIKEAVLNPVNKLTLSGTLAQHRRQVIYEVQKTITVGILTGQRYSTMAERLNDRVFHNYTKTILTVRTETHRVRETGHNNLSNELDEKLRLADAPYRLVKTWLNMKDSLVRGNPSGKYPNSKADHWKLEGQAVLQNENFDLGKGVTAPCPGQSGKAYHDCNCRCILKRRLLTDEEFFAITGRHFPHNDGAENTTYNTVERVKTPPKVETAVKRKNISRSNKPSTKANPVEITGVTVGHNVGNTGTVYRDEKINFMGRKNVDKSGESGIINTRGSGTGSKQHVEHSYEKIGSIDINDKKAVAKSLQEFERKYQNSDIEHCRVITSNGEIYEVHGDEFTVDTSLLGDLMQGSINEHNHVSGYSQYSFSWADLNSCIVDKTSQCIAYDEKFRYSMTFDKVLSESIDISDIRSKAEENVYNRIINNEEIMDDDIQHEKIKYACDLLNIIYERSRL